MPLSESIVAVVLTPNFGDRLQEFAQWYPVWVVQSDINNPAIQQVRQSLLGACNVTSFREYSGHTPEEAFPGLLDTIDLHHHAWATLEVHGCTCSPEIRTALATFGARTIEEYPAYFVAHRIPGSLEGNP